MNGDTNKVWGDEPNRMSLRYRPGKGRHNTVDDLRAKRTGIRGKVTIEKRHRGWDISDLEVELGGEESGFCFTENEEGEVRTVE